MNILTFYRKAKIKENYAFKKLLTNAVSFKDGFCKNNYKCTK